MKINRSIFKAYDIRGLVDKDLSPEFAYHLGKAFATLRMREEGRGELTFVIARDMRLSSEGYQKELMRGINELGCNVKDIGFASAPTFYYSIDALKSDGGVIVTASHNPGTYNGFKPSRPHAAVLGGPTGILDLADLMESDDYMAVAEKPGEIEQVDGMTKAAVKMQIDFIGAEDFSDVKAIADTANGMGALYLDELFTQGGMEAERMYFELDGNFPNHEANPKVLENLVDIQERMRAGDFDLGIATDGDGDRVFLLDEKGDLVDPWYVHGIVAQEILRKHPGAKIVRDIRPARIINEMVEDAGGEVLLVCAGSPMIKKEIRDKGALFGGESSGHFMYAFKEGAFEGPVSVIAAFLARMKREGKPLSEIIAPYRIYDHSGEHNFEVENKEEALERLKNAFADGEVNEMDGVSVTFPDFWFNARPSNTEPLLRLNLEAVDEKTMKEKLAEVRRIIEG
jgi:phosphomannomutase